MLAFSQHVFFLFWEKRNRRINEFDYGAECCYSLYVVLTMIRVCRIRSNRREVVAAGCDADAENVPSSIADLFVVVVVVVVQMDVLACRGF